MSYIVAYVSLPKSKINYPVECYRTDIKVGDAVVVRVNSRGGKLISARVVSVEYLNWNCKNRIECLESEAQFESEGITLPIKCPTKKGVSTPYDVFCHLYQTGWIPRKPKNKSFNIAYTRNNASHSANIFFRNNGVDIQVFPIEGDQDQRPNSLIGFFPTKQKTVRNFLSHNKVNALEQVIRFADSFGDNVHDYASYMSWYGSGKQDPRMPSRRSDNPDRTLYNLLGGDGGNVYLGDGLSLSSSGKWVDD